MEGPWLIHQPIVIKMAIIFIRCVRLCLKAISKWSLALQVSFCILVCVVLGMEMVNWCVFFAQIVLELDMEMIVIGANEAEKRLHEATQPD